MADQDGSAPDEVPSNPPTPETVQVWVSNHRTFLSFPERRVGDRALAEDILQDAFVKGLDKVELLRSDESAVAWFYRLLRNAVVDHHRRRSSAGRAFDALAAGAADQVEPDFETRDTICGCVAELAGTLKPEYSEALRRVEIDGIPVQQYAHETGISSNNAGVRVFRAREALLPGLPTC